MSIQVRANNSADFVAALAPISNEQGGPEGAPLEAAAPARAEGERLTLAQDPWSHFVDEPKRL